MSQVNTNVRSKRRCTLYPTALPKKSKHPEVQVFKHFDPTKRYSDSDNSDIELPEINNSSTELSVNLTEGNTNTLRKFVQRQKKRLSSVTSNSSDDSKPYHAVKFSKNPQQLRTSNKKPAQKPQKTTTQLRPPPAGRLETETRKKVIKKAKAIKLPEKENTTFTSSNDVDSRTSNSTGKSSTKNKVQIDSVNVKRNHELHVSSEITQGEIKKKLESSRENQDDFSIIDKNYIQELIKEISTNKPTCVTASTDVKDLRAEIAEFKKLLQCGCSVYDSANYVEQLTAVEKQIDIPLSLEEPGENQYKSIQFAGTEVSPASSIRNQDDAKGTETTDDSGGNENFFKTQHKNIRMVDDLVQQAERTLKKIRAQNKKYSSNNIKRSGPLESSTKVSLTDEVKKSAPRLTSKVILEAGVEVVEVPKDQPVLTIYHRYSNTEEDESSLTMVSEISRELNTISEVSEVEGSEPRVTIVKIHAVPNVPDNTSASDAEKSLVATAVPLLAEPKDCSINSSGTTGDLNTKLTTTKNDVEHISDCESPALHTVLATSEPEISKIQPESKSAEHTIAQIEQICETEDSDKTKICSACQTKQDNEAIIFNKHTHGAIKKLTVQKMIPLDIRTGLVVQKLTQIGIEPYETRPVEATKENVYYEEVIHNNGRASGSRDSEPLLHEIRSEKFVVSGEEPPCRNSLAVETTRSLMNNDDKITQTYALNQSLPITKTSEVAVTVPSLSKRSDSEKVLHNIFEADTLEDCDGRSRVNSVCLVNSFKKLQESVGKSVNDMKERSRGSCLPDDSEDNERHSFFKSFQVFSENEPHEPEELATQISSIDIDANVYKTFINPEGLQDEDLPQSALQLTKVPSYYKTSELNKDYFKTQPKPKEKGSYDQILTVIDEVIKYTADSESEGIVQNSSDSIVKGTLKIPPGFCQDKAILCKMEADGYPNKNISPKASVSVEIQSICPEDEMMNFTIREPPAKQITLGDTYIYDISSRSSGQDRNISETFKEDAEIQYSQPCIISTSTQAVPAFSTKAIDVVCSPVSLQFQPDDRKRRRVSYDEIEVADANTQVSDDTFGSIDVSLTEEDDEDAEEGKDKKEDHNKILSIKEEIRSSVSAVARHVPSFQTKLIQHMNKDIEEAAAKTQEDIEVYFHPTEDALQQIRRQSVYLDHYKKKVDQLSDEDSSDEDEKPEEQSNETEKDQVKPRGTVQNTYFVKEKFQRTPLSPLESNTPGGDNSDIHNYLKVDENGRYIDEANNFCAPCFPKYEDIPAHRKQKYVSHLHTNTSESSESLSEGEIKCRCSVSIGEIHRCKHANHNKKRAEYFKRHPEKLIRRETGNPSSQILSQKVYYSNWVAYYVSK